MKLLLATSAALFSLAALNSHGAPASLQTANNHAARDGIIFKNYPYTILRVKACCSRNSAEGEYDHTVVLRFHQDNSCRVDIKVLSPGEEREDWGACDEWGTYTSSGSGGTLHYSLTDRGANELQLNVRSIGPTSRNPRHTPVCPIRLKQSSYTYSLQGGNKLFIYDLAEDAIIAASNS